MWVLDNLRNFWKLLIRKSKYVIETKRGSKNE